MEVLSKLELLQKIGDQVCEGCGPDRDCELEYDECMRLDVATQILDVWMARERGE